MGAGMRGGAWGGAFGKSFGHAFGHVGAAQPQPTGGSGYLQGVAFRRPRPKLGRTRRSRERDDLLILSRP